MQPKTNLLNLLIFIQTVVSSGSFQCSTAPTSPSSLCGVHGSLARPEPSSDSTYGALYIFANQTVDSLDTCRDYCMTRSTTARWEEKAHLAGAKCASFGFNSTSNLCTLYYQSLSAQGFIQRSTSDMVFYDKQCFKCTEPCARKPGENLLLNGDFQVSKLLGPWALLPQEGKFSNPTFGSPGYNSTGALYCVHPGCRKIFQSPDLCPNQFYRFTGKWLLERTNFTYGGRRRAELGIVAGDTGLAGIVADDHLGKWQSVDLTFQYSLGHGLPPHSLPALKEGVELLLQAAPKFSLLFDDAVLTLAPQTYQTTGDNLLINGDFETGNKHPWTIPKNLYHSKKANKELKIVSPGLTPGSKYALQYSAAAGYYVRQRGIPTKEGTTYVLSFDWAFTPSTGHIEVAVGPRLEPLSTTITQTYWNIEYYQDSHFERTFVAYSNFTILGFYQPYPQESIITPFGPQDGPSSWTIDNVVIKELAS